MTHCYFLEPAAGPIDKAVLVTFLKDMPTNSSGRFLRRRACLITSIFQCHKPYSRSFIEEKTSWLSRIFHADNGVVVIILQAHAQQLLRQIPRKKSVPNRSSKEEKKTSWHKPRGLYPILTLPNIVPYRLHLLRLMVCTLLPHFVCAG